MYFFYLTTKNKNNKKSGENHRIKIFVLHFLIKFLIEIIFDCFNFLLLIIYYNKSFI